MMNKELFKIMMLGDAGVGKTAMLERFVKNIFSSEYKVTIGADFLHKEVVVQGVRANLQIWDTAGQERFRALGRQYYKGADGCVLVFDITSRTTFESLEKWMDAFLVQANPADIEEFPFVVVGNKVDLEDERKVSKTDADNWGDKMNGIKYFECSAKENVNIVDAFHHLISQCLERPSRQKKYIYIYILL